MRPLWRFLEAALILLIREAAHGCGLSVPSFWTYVVVAGCLGVFAGIVTDPPPEPT